MVRPVGTATTMVTGVGPRPNPRGSVVKPLNLLCVRDDGYLCMGNEDILQMNPHLRIYHGKVTDSPEQIEAFLRGQEERRYGTPVLDPSQVDITRMSVADLIAFALDEYGVTLPESTDYPTALVTVIKARAEAEELDRKATNGKQSKGLSLS